MLLTAHTHMIFLVPDSGQSPLWLLELYKISYLVASLATCKVVVVLFVVPLESLTSHFGSLPLTKVHEATTITMEHCSSCCMARVTWFCFDLFRLCERKLVFMYKA